MKATLVFGAAALALAAGGALAERSKDDPGFNKLDQNHDGHLTRSEAAKNPYLAKNFKAADKNGDGQLSRTEYLEAMTKKDLQAAKEKVSGGDKNGASGASKPSR